MASIANVIEALQNVFGTQADKLGRSSGFIKRQRNLRGSAFVQGLVFGWLGNENASLNELRQAFGQVGVETSRQNIAQRFTQSASEFMKQMVELTLQTVITGQTQSVAALQRFGKVYVMDSTVIKLPDELVQLWAGIQGSALKLSVCWDLQYGHLPVLHTHAAREHDRKAPLAWQDLAAGDLWLADLGYFKLDDFQAMAERGIYWVSRYKTRTDLYHLDGTPFDLKAYVAELPDDEPHTIEVLMGQTHQLPVRLVVQKVTDEKRLKRRAKKLNAYERKKQTQASSLRHFLNDYDIFITNIPNQVASAALILELGRLRWQIELLFKLFKNELKVDEWRTANPWRILCELYAKLMAILIQHWLFMLGDVHHLQQSLTLARQVVRHYSWELARHLWNTWYLQGILASLRDALRLCHTHSSPSRLTSFKRLSP